MMQKPQCCNKIVNVKHTLVSTAIKRKPSRLKKIGYSQALKLYVELLHFNLFPRLQLEMGKIILLLNHSKEKTA